MAIYDTNEDSELDTEEIEKAPLLKRSVDTIDADKDGKITTREFADRVRAWQDSADRVMRATPTIYLGDRPLVGATVTLEPAPFLGPNYPIATAVTNSRGTARFAGEDARYPGVYVGLYTMRISKIVEGKETIPAKYNTESELGFEVSPENWIFTRYWGISLDKE